MISRSGGSGHSHSLVTGRRAYADPIDEGSGEKHGPVKVLVQDGRAVSPEGRKLKRAKEGGGALPITI
jgi:hypothetical protein